MRYVIAFLAACLIVAAGVAFCAHTRQSLIDDLREHIRNPENADETTAELESMLDEGILPPDFGTEVSPSLLWRLQIADLLARLWYVWIILALGACFAVAHFLVR